MRVFTHLLYMLFLTGELCIADGASKEKHVKEILDSYAKKDNRIKLKYLTENKGI